MQESAMYGYIDTVRIILNDERYNPAVDNSSIEYASCNGHVEIVKLLLKDSRINPFGQNNTPILCASQNGHVDIVKMLLCDSRVDPSARNNEPIRRAFQNMHYRVVSILLCHPKVQSTLSIQDKMHYTEFVNQKLKNDARKMIPYYSQGFHETYRLPDDIMHVILGEFTFGYTTKECSMLLKCL